MNYITLFSFLILERGWLYVLTKKPIKRWGIFSEEKLKQGLKFHIKKVKSSEAGKQWGINEHVKQQFQNVSVRTCCSPNENCSTITCTPNKDFENLKASLKSVSLWVIFRHRTGFANYIGKNSFSESREEWLWLSAHSVSRSWEDLEASVQQENYDNSCHHENFSWLTQWMTINSPKRVGKEGGSWLSGSEWWWWYDWLFKNEREGQEDRHHGGNLL